MCGLVVVRKEKSHLVEFNFQSNSFRIRHNINDMLWAVKEKLFTEQISSLDETIPFESDSVVKCTVFIRYFSVGDERSIVVELDDLILIITVWLCALEKVSDMTWILGETT